MIGFYDNVYGKLPLLLRFLHGKKAFASSDVFTNSWQKKGGKERRGQTMSDT